MTQSPTHANQPSPDFLHWLREALAHLYDRLYLQESPLAGQLLPEDEVRSAGDRLHQLLLAAIEVLRPPPHTPRSDPAWRPYSALYLRHVEGRDLPYVAQALAIGDRQLRREYARGLEALATQLWDTTARRDYAPGSERAGATRRAEVGRFGADTGQEKFANVVETIQGVLETLADYLAERGTMVRVDAPPELPQAAIGRSVLRQILLNAVTHLFDDGSCVGLQIVVRLRGEQLELAFVNAASQSERPEDANSDDRLDVVQHLLAMHGGELDTDVSHSIRLRMVLPAHIAPIVLFVDDNPDVLQLFERYLAGSGYAVSTMRSTDQAVAAAQHLRPAAIVLDVMMPGQDGWELLQRLKNHPVTANIPVLVCSVLREQSLATTLGASGFLAKPVTRQALLHALGQAVDLPASPAHPGSP